MLTTITGVKSLDDLARSSAKDLKDKQASSHFYSAIPASAPLPWDTLIIAAEPRKSEKQRTNLFEIMGWVYKTEGASAL